jgi:hypothetical protein
MLAEIEDLPRQLKSEINMDIKADGITAVNYNRISLAMLTESGRHLAEKLPQIQASKAIVV